MTSTFNNASSPITTHTQTDVDSVGMPEDKPARGDGVAVEDVCCGAPITEKEAIAHSLGAGSTALTRQKYVVPHSSSPGYT